MKQTITQLLVHVDASTRSAGGWKWHVPSPKPTARP